MKGKIPGWLNNRCLFGALWAGARHCPVPYTHGFIQILCCHPPFTGENNRGVRWCSGRAWVSHAVGWLPSPCSSPLEANLWCGGCRSGSQHGTVRLSPLNEESQLGRLTGRSVEIGGHSPCPRGSRGARPWFPS